MKTLVDGLTCIMMFFIIVLCSRILFPERTEQFLNDATDRWEDANERVADSTDQ